MTYYLVVVSLSKNCHLREAEYSKIKPSVSMRKNMSSLPAARNYSVARNNNAE